jgi:hypothetical protein
MKYFFTISLLLQFFIPVVAQDSTKSNGITISGFADFYYQYDFDNPASKERPSFLFNYKRHNEFAVNLAFLKLSYAANKTRANIGLMAGTYPQYNLSAEPQLFQHVWEANIGYAFSDKLSIDAGILPSHIGLETAVSKDNWNLSRSVLAENTPYYETGIKLNYIPNEKWTTSFLILNGWQNIKETNSGKAIGTQIQFKPNERWLFNSSTFIGNEKPDSAKQVRLFHNFYMTYSASKKLDLAFLFDMGTEKKNDWYGTALLIRYLFSSAFSSAFRFEYYKDKSGVIIPINQPGGFQTKGFAINFDYSPAKNIAFRTEVRCLRANNDIFIKNRVPKNNNCSVLGSIAVSF